MKRGLVLSHYGSVPLRSVIATLVSVVLVAVLFWAFAAGRREAAAEQERERPVKEPSRVSVEHGENVVTLDSATLARSGILTARLDSAAHREEVRAYGAVMDLQQLADLRSRYASAFAQEEKARAAVEASRREYERLRGLYEDNQNVSAKALEAARATRRADEATLDAAVAPAHALAATLRQDWGPVIGGWLIDGPPALTRLLDRREVLIQATLPPDRVLATRPRTAFVQAGRGSRIRADVVSAAGRTDPRIQGLSFFLVAPGTSGLLPGMSVTAWLPAGQPVLGLVVPESAVVWWQGKAWAYFEVGPTTFVRREVSTARSVEGGFAVDTAPPDTRVVTRGAQALLSEELRVQFQVTGGEDER